MTDEEMEVAFRHELAHFLRRDHWWRWVLTWIVDVGRVASAVGWLANQAGALEEQLCDRLAIRTAPDAVALARALTKSAEVNSVKPSQRNAFGTMDSFPIIPAAVVPSLTGQSSLWQSNPRAIQSRLTHLLHLINEPLVADNMSMSNSTTLKMAWTQKVRRAGQFLSYGIARTVFSFFLFLFMYIKYCCYLNVFLMKSRFQEPSSF